MGILKGLGAGMVSFGQSMRQTRKMDWDAKQQELQFMRQKNLENLRATNNRQLQEEQRTFTTGERVAGQEYRAGERVGGMLGGVEVTKREIGELSPEERGEVKGVEEYRAGIAVDTAKQKKVAELEVMAKYKKDQLAELTASPDFQALPPEQQQYVRLGLAANGKVDLSSLTKGTKLKTPSAELLSLTMETMSQNEAFVNLKPSVQLATANLWALKQQNPSLDFGAGDKEVPEDKLEDVAKDVLKGNVSATEFVRFTPDSQQRILDTMQEVAVDGTEERKVDRSKWTSVREGLGGARAAAEPSTMGDWWKNLTAPLRGRMEALRAEGRQQ